jgi:hypothetical protein
LGRRETGRVTVTAGGSSVEKVAREAEETEANEGGSEYCLSWLATLLYFLHFSQPPLPPTKLGAAKPWPAYGVDKC